MSCCFSRQTLFGICPETPHWAARSSWSLIGKQINDYDLRGYGFIFGTEIWHIGCLAFDHAQQEERCVEKREGRARPSD